MLVAGIAILILGGLLFVPGMFIAVDSFVICTLANRKGWIGILLVFFAMLAFVLSGYLIGQCDPAEYYGRTLYNMYN